MKNHYVNNTNILPSNYKYLESIDLKNNQRVNNLIQIVFLAIALLMVGFAIIFKLPIKNDLGTVIKILITVLSCVVYMILHELTHGVFIRLFSHKRANYYFRFPYLATGSSSYFNKKSFIIITLSPVIIWGIILGLLLVLLPQYLFLTIYVVIGINFAGASGDYFQVYRFANLDKTALIQDDGKETKIFVLESPIND